MGPYMLRRRLGRGGFGEVWLARDGHGRSYALKLPLSAAGRRRLLAGARAQAEVRHPNVVEVVGLYLAQQPPYVVYRYHGAGTLRQHLGRGALDPAAALALMHDLFAGLAAIHDAGLLHLDVKPENVLRDGWTRSWLLTDLGMGPSDAALQRSVDLCSAGSGPALTLPYAAPELLNDRRRWRGADLYACGIVLFEVLTGRLPAGRELPSEACGDRDLPPWCDRLFEALVAPPDRRLADARAARRRLPEPGAAARSGRRTGRRSTILTADALPSAVVTERPRGVMGWRDLRPADAPGSSRTGAPLTVPRSTDAACETNVGAATLGAGQLFFGFLVMMIFGSLFGWC